MRSIISISLISLLSLVLAMPSDLQSRVNSKAEFGSRWNDADKFWLCESRNFDNCVYYNFNDSVCMSLGNNPLKRLSVKSPPGRRCYIYSSTDCTQQGMNVGLRSPDLSAVVMPTPLSPSNIRAFMCFV
ncbi:hypothetical protein M501DRAFT_986322 [Patellaria atrata CBS 101060]|uniref:Uncharacterized protein n=1 Tax=Patellaria atrata CBS 101060 TaxID=1346257 RepID=A0A9P4VN98_9PEZI|nr:hypothetical protein M501DRAFT_986322 [Patellaria atrata CBS 101060]